MSRGAMGRARRRWRRRLHRLVEAIGLLRTRQPLPAELLFGYRAIGRFLGLTRGQARALVRRRAIPCFTLDGVPCALPSSLRRHLTRLEIDHGQQP